MKKHAIVNFLFIFFLFSQKDSIAQNNDCGTYYIHNQSMQSDSVYRKQFLNVESQVETIINNKHHNSLQSTVYTIPVVVHVIHLGEAIGVGTNIPDSQIINAISGLNDRFRHITGNGVDVEVQFCLATRDTNGNQTTGINRVSGAGLANYAAHGITMFYSNCDAPSEAAVKDLSRWPVSEYYNIWVVNQICQNFGGFVGAATYPNGSPYDGNTIKYSYMNRSSYLLAHEIGHGFLLYHTFEGDGGNVNCPIDTNCNLNGDHVCDTPPHKQNDCLSSNPCTATGTWSNSLNNYMSYCGLWDRYTQGQKDRIRATAIVSPRVSLLSSLGCSLVGVYGIESETSFVISPNPATKSFSIKSTHRLRNPQLVVCNLLGEKIYSAVYDSEPLTVNCEHFLPGIYVVSLKTANGISVQKLIKQ